MGIRLWIADMDSDGVRFTDEQIEIMESERAALLCNYSGLPSILTYIDETQNERL